GQSVVAWRQEVEVARAPDHVVLRRRGQRPANGVRVVGKPQDAVVLGAPDLDRDRHASKTFRVLACLVFLPKRPIYAPPGAGGTLTRGDAPNSLLVVAEGPAASGGPGPGGRRA